MNKKIKTTTRKLFLLSFLLGFVFFIIGVLNLKYYSVNWDEPVHFGRGHAILHFFLTGEKNYNSFKDKPIERRSYYQNVEYTIDFFEQRFKEGGTFIVGGGHPPLSDLIASIFNKVFYEKLNILPDIESFHLYSVFLASVLVSTIYYFTVRVYGNYAGLISSIALILYPLFLSESRFNIKDIPEAVFYILTALFFYNGVVTNKIRWIFVSSIFFSFALGTKLNILFLSFSLAPWLIMYWLPTLKKYGLRKFIVLNRKILLSLMLYPIIGMGVFIASWPLLWSSTFERLFTVIQYYKSVGVNSEFDHRYITFFGLNTYAIQWILFTTPPITLILTAFGIIRTYLVGKKEKDKFSLLILFLFLIPIIRVTAPNTGIYGGVRQIMEYIPAMAILSGIGGWYIVEKLKGYTNQPLFLLRILILFLFTPVVFKLISLHPNENLYFNFLIGGLSGAKEKDIPGWGNTLGSVYRQGTNWLNLHAEKNAKLALIYELASNIPPMELRSDIYFYNHVRSAYKQEGEYIIGLVHQGTNRRGYHRKYLERFLNPVYEIKVDGVPVLKIWKNERKYTKKEYSGPENKLDNVPFYIENGNLIVDVKKNVKLTKIEIKYEDNNCTYPKNGYFLISQNRREWERLQGDFVFFPLASWFTTQPEKGKLNFLLAGDDARYIQVVIEDVDSCLVKNKSQITVWYI